MNTLNPPAIFKELCDLADTELDDRLPERIQQLQGQGIELKVNINLDEPEFITDPNSYTEVIQYCELWISDAKVYERQETYWGFFGGMGGWLVDRARRYFDRLRCTGSLGASRSFTRGTRSSQTRHCRR